MTAALATLCSAGLLALAGALSATQAGSPMDTPERVDQPAAAVVERPAEQFLVLRVRLGARVLSEALAAYRADERADSPVLLPVAGLLGLLEFDVRLLHSAGKLEVIATGTSEPVSLDLATHTLRISADRMEVPGHVERHADDHYADPIFFLRALELTLVLDQAAMTVEISSPRPLPVISRLEREGRWSELGARQDGLEVEIPDASLPGYGVFAWPSVDAAISTNYRGREGEASQVRVNHSFLAQGDLLGMTSRFFVTGQHAGQGDGNSRSARFSLSRHDREGGLLGGLKATDVILGDLQSVGNSLISRGGFGRGISIARRTDHLRSSSLYRNRKTIRGDGLPGWDVELYRNGSLVDAQQVGADGRFEFSDVSLVSGDNRIRLVFYGPGGRIREETDRLFVGAELLAPGDSVYQIALYEHEVGVFSSSEVSSRRQLATHGEPRLSWRYRRGLTSGLTFEGSLSSLQIQDGRHEYVELGLLSNRLGGSQRLSLVTDRRGGWAAELRLERSFGRFSLFADHARFESFRSDLVSSHELESRSEVRIHGSLALPKVGALPIGFAARRLVSNGLDQLEMRASASLSIPIVGFRLANRWNVLYSGDEAAIQGLMRTHGRLGPVHLRGGLGYSLLPHPELNDLDLLATWRRSNRIHWTVGLSQRIDEAVTRLSSGVEIEAAPMLISLSTGIGTDGSVEAGVSVSFNMTRNPRSGRWLSRARGSAGSGVVSARVFLDRDSDGRFGGGDTPLEGVRLRSGEGLLGPATAADGTALFDVPAYVPMAMRVDKASLLDPALLPLGDGFAVALRPGIGRTVDLPVFESAEVDGTVYLKRGHASTPAAAANLELQLVDEGGRVVQVTPSQHDGFYLFQALLPGSYLLRLAPESARRIGVCPEHFLQLRLEAGEVRSGQDLVLELASSCSPERRAADSPSRGTGSLSAAGY